MWPIPSYSTPFFSTVVDRKKITFAITLQETIFATIEVNGKIQKAVLKGIPETIEGLFLPTLRATLANECRFFVDPYGGLTVSVRLKGGAGAAMFFYLFAKYKKELLNLPLASYEKIQESGAGDLIPPLLAVLAAKNMPNSPAWNKIFSTVGNAQIIHDFILTPAKNFYNRLFDDSPAKQRGYVAEIDTIAQEFQSKKIDEMQAIARLERYLQVNLPRDIKNKETKLQQTIDYFRKAHDNNMDAFQPYVEIGALTWSFIDKQQAANIRLGSLALCQGISSGIALKKIYDAGALVSWAGLQATGKFLFSVVGPLAAMVIQGISGINDPNAEALVQLADSIRTMQQEQKDCFAQIEMMLGGIYQGVTQEIANTRGDIAALKKLSADHFDRIDKTLKDTYQALDKKLNKLKEQKYSETVERAMGEADSFLSLQNFSSYSATFLTWANRSSKDAIFVDTDLQEVWYGISLLNKYLNASFSNLTIKYPCNLIIWAHAVDALMELWMKVDAQSQWRSYFSYVQSPAYKQRVREIEETGKSLASFIAKIQLSKSLFAYLIEQYRVSIIAIRDEVLKVSPDDTRMKKWLKEINETYLLIHALTQIAFSRSRKEDLYFISLLKSQTLLPHALLNKQEIEKEILRCQGDHHQYHLFFENLEETALLLESCIMQKIDSHAKGNSDDQDLLLFFVLQKFSSFWNKFYPNEPPIGTFFSDLKPCHITDVSQLPIIKSDIFLAAKLGCMQEVMDLIASGEDVNKRNPATGRAILHEAVQGGHEELVKRLLQVEGINFNIADNGGKTPLDLAKGAIGNLLSCQDHLIELRRGKQFQLVSASVERLPGFNVYQFEITKNWALTIEHGAVQLWDLAAGRLLKRLGVESYLRCTAKKNILIHCPTGRPSQIYDLRDPSLKPITLEEMICTVHTIDLKNNRLLGAPPLRRELIAFDLTTGRVTQRLKYEGGVLYPSSGEYSLQKGYENTVVTLIRPQPIGMGKIETWDLTTGQKIQSFQADLGIGYVVVSKRRAAVIQSNHIVLYDLFSGQKEFVIQLQGNPIPGGMIIDRSLQEVYLSEDKLIAPIQKNASRKIFGIWDLNKRKLIGNIDNIHTITSWAVPSWECRKEKKAVLISNSPWQLRIYDVEQEKDLGAFNCGPQPFLGQYLLRGSILIASYPTCIKFFDIYSKRCLQTIEGVHLCKLILSENRLIGVDKNSRQVKVWQL